MIRSDALYLDRVITALAIEPGDRVLEIGTGEGAATRAIAALGGQVTTFELDAEAAAEARLKLSDLDVRVLDGDGLGGLPEEELFDAILVSARVPSLPLALKQQLAHGGGRLVATVGTFRVRQRLVRVVRTEADQYVEESLGEVLFCSSLEQVFEELGIDPERASEDDRCLALSLLHGIERGSVTRMIAAADPELLRRLAPAFQQRGEVIPTRRDRGLVVAVCDPEVDDNAVAMALGSAKTRRLLLTPTEMERLRRALLLGRVEDLEAEAPSTSPDLLESKEAGPGALFDALLLEAAGQGASDLHLERYGERTRVRLRVDGLLHDLERFTLDAEEHDAILRILEVSSGMDITEHVRPQAGRFTRTIGARALDLRAQVQPSHDGNNAVIRILEPSLLGIEELGFPEDAATLWAELIQQPAGLVLVTGPTGCGKTTTLYAALRELAADPTRKVLSLEDPVEYSLFGIQQVQIGPGIDFANGTRSLVRQDPDVLFVGEIRDPETALEAIRASQTGHLVLTTLHCNDAPDAVQRLYDLGVHPNSIASELLAVLNQRLVRRTCVHCAGAGCTACHGRGTKGRVPLVEVLVADDVLRTAIADRTGLDELRALALKRGLQSLHARAEELVAREVISSEERRRVLGSLH